MELVDIKQYIIKMYPDSTFIINYANIDDFDELRDGCEEFFYDEFLSWCSCGASMIVKKTIRDYLQLIQLDFTQLTRHRGGYNISLDDLHAKWRERFGVNTIYENELLLCLAYTLDAAGFTDHGSSISNAWLTDEGEMFLWLLNHNTALDSQS